jgi:ketosteroid isomerase-like protein
MSNDSVRVLEEIYAAISGRDLDAFLALTDPRVEFRSLIAEAGGGTFRGHEGVRAWWDEVICSLGVQPNPEQIEAFRDRGITRMRLAGTVGGVEVPQAMWMAWRVRDGRLIWWQTFRDEDGALAAVGLSE